MTDDPTESTRRALVAANEGPAETEQTWTTEEMTRDFEPIGFMAPFIVVRRRSDGAKGSLQFKNSPRVYFGWSASA